MKRVSQVCVLVAVSMGLAACGDRIDGPLPLTSSTLDRAITYLQMEYQSPDAAVRANCVEAMQALRDPRAAALIEQGLRDPEWVVRFAAAMASAELKGARADNARPALTRLATSDPSGSVRAGSIYALRRLGDPALMSDLAVLLQSSDLATQANTAYVLGLLRDKSAIVLLDRYRDVSDIRVKFEVTSAKARLGDEAAQQVIVGLAVNKFAEDQWTAMRVCADLPPTIGRSPLLLGLEDMPVKMPEAMQTMDVEAVRALTTRRQLIAARSLARMGDYTGAKVAIDHATNKDPSLRALAALALGDMLDSHKGPAMDRMLADPDDTVKRAAAAAIVAIYARAQAAGGM